LEDCAYKYIYTHLRGNMDMICQIAAREDAADRALFEMEKDAPAGFLKCPGCGELKPEGEFQPISPDPYAMPGCGDCFEEYYADKAIRNAPLFVEKTKSVLGE
jgi:hypothetical protein